MIQVLQSQCEQEHSLMYVKSYILEPNYLPWSTLKLTKTANGLKHIRSLNTPTQNDICISPPARIVANKCTVLVMSLD